MTNQTKTKRIFILAGEQSGDLIGGRLMQEILKVENEPVEFIGIGGQAMKGYGLKSLFPMKELSLMGIFEVITHLPNILKRLNQVKQFIIESRPDAIITIDSPDFSFRIAKKIRGSGIPHIHYIAPTVWAWRPGRAKKISKIIDHLLCVLPFEPPYFTKYNLPCTFVGHMVTELGIANIPREAFRQKHNISKDTTLICVLPGSRHGEVTRLLPIFVETLKKLITLHPNLKIVIPLADSITDIVQEDTRELSDIVIFTRDQQEKYEAMRACNVALAASGTVNLELAMAGVPFVIGYKINPITAWIAPLLVKIKYMTMTNILLNKPIIPEFFQNDCTSDNLFKALNNLLSDQPTRESMIYDMQKAVAMLKPSNATPSQLAAKVVLT